MSGRNCEEPEDVVCVTAITHCLRLRLDVRPVVNCGEDRLQASLHLNQVLMLPPRARKARRCGMGILREWGEGS